METNNTTLSGSEILNAGMKNHKFAMFTEDKKSTFAYWFNHWKAFNLTAYYLGVWKPKHLLHDFEKPWLMWLWKDYPRVKAYHRTHARHHLRYAGKRGLDWEAMIIDWECSRFTKVAAPLTALQTTPMEMEDHPDMADEIAKNCYPIINRLNLTV